MKKKYNYNDIDELIAKKILDFDKLNVISVIWEKSSFLIIFEQKSKNGSFIFKECTSLECNVQRSSNLFLSIHDVQKEKDYFLVELICPDGYFKIESKNFEIEIEK